MSNHAVSATLPQELIDLILEQLWLDIDAKSLIACLTVSKAFFLTARACLWRDKLFSSGLNGVPLSLDRIPPTLRSLVRSMSLYVENTDSCWQAHNILVNAFERVNYLHMFLPSRPGRIPSSPVIGRWHIVSLHVTSLHVAPGAEAVHAAANSCAFFENFPMLKHLGLHFPACRNKESTLCTATRHHKLPQLVSLKLRDVVCANVYSIIVAGHMFSLGKLRTLELTFPEVLPEVESLLAAVSDTMKELIVRVRSEHSRLFLFHHAESILFYLDTQRQARDMLLWWTRVMVHNQLNNTVRKVTIEIQMYLGSEQRAPTICFSKVWIEFGKALGGLMALKELAIVFQPAGSDRIGNADDAATRARVTKFLRRKLTAIVDPARVQLTIIDRNV